VGEEEMDVIGLERKQMIVDVLVMPLLPKQKKTTMMMITVNGRRRRKTWRQRY